MQPTQIELARTDARLLQISNKDNVLVATAEIAKGEIIRIRDQPVTVAARVPLGHKMAACDIAAGEKIIKYGVPIGSAIVSLKTGDHVHTHNIKSDYLPTYTRESQQSYFAEHH